MKNFNDLVSVVNTFGWNVTDPDEDGIVWVSKEMPMDFHFLEERFACSAKDFAESFKNYAEGYAQFMMDWWNGLDKDGRDDLPTASELVHDVYSIERMLKETATALS